MTAIERALLTLTTRLRKYMLPLGIALALLVIALVVPPVATSLSSGFYERYEDLSLNYEELQTSKHAGIECSACHAQTGGLALVGDFYAGLVGERRTPRFLEFESPQREACLACHGSAWSHDAERVSRIPHPAHPRLASETRECVECHKWTAHAEIQIEPHKEMPFSGVCVAYGCHVGFRSADECDSCHHVLRGQTRDWIAEHPQAILTIGANACLEACHDSNQCQMCHTTGERPVFDGLMAETGLEEIERLHAKPDWPVSHGPISLEDQAACMRCHVTDSECRACHAHRPSSHDPVETWITRHKDLFEEDADWLADDRCFACHERSWCEECHDQFKEMR